MLFFRVFLHAHLKQIHSHFLRYAEATAQCIALLVCVLDVYLVCIYTSNAQTKPSIPTLATRRSRLRFRSDFFQKV